MTLSDYHQNLSTWVDAQQAKGYSVRQLAKAITKSAQKAGVETEVKYGAVWGWKAGRIKGELQEDKLQAIAAFEGVTPEEMRRKLRSPLKGKTGVLTREQVVDWVARTASVRDAAFVGVAVAQKFKDSVDLPSSQFPVLLDNSSGLSGEPNIMDEVTLQPFADLRLSIALRRSLEAQGLTYSQAADQGLNVVGERDGEDFRILTSLIRKVCESRYRSTPRYSKKYFEAIASQCFRVLRWNGEEPEFGTERYDRDYQGLIADLEKIGNGNGLAASHHS